MKLVLGKMLSVGLVVVILCAQSDDRVRAAAAADPPKPAQDQTADTTLTSPVFNKVSVDTSNVILSRELVNVTKLQEFLVILQQQILGARSNFSTSAGSIDSVDSLKLQIDQAKASILLEREILNSVQGEILSLESEFKDPVETPSGDLDAQSRNDAKFAGVLSQLQSLKKKADELELQIRTTSDRISRLSPEVSRLKDHWMQEQNDAMYSARSLNSLEGLLASSEIALPQIAGVASLQAVPQYASSVPQPWASPSRYSDDLPLSTIPIPSVPDAASEPLRNLASDERHTLLRRLKKLDSEIATTEDSITELEEETKSIGQVSKDAVAAAAANETLRKSLIDKIQNKMTRNQARKITLEETLAFRDEDLNQFQINQLLVYAVYGMIASIIGSFILLRVYPSSLTGLVLEQRVIVEVLSMGFLLVTVIILGSAKIITGEGLAGLLGTIAGYIFVKKTSESMGADRNGNGGSVIDRALDAAHLDVVNVKAALAEQIASAGESPTGAAKKKIAATEFKLQQAELRAQSLAEIASAKSARGKNETPEP